MKKFEIKITEEEGDGITEVFFTDKPTCGVKGVAFKPVTSEDVVNELIKMYDAIPKSRNRNEN